VQSEWLTGKDNVQLIKNEIIRFTGKATVENKAGELSSAGMRFLIKKMTGLSLQSAIIWNGRQPYSGIL